MAKKKTTKPTRKAKTTAAARPRRTRRPAGLVAGTTIPDAVAATPQRTPDAPTFSTLFDRPGSSRATAAAAKSAAMEPCVEVACALPLGHDGNHTDGRGTFWGSAENGGVTNRRPAKRVARTTSTKIGKRHDVEHLAMPDQDDARHWGGDAERRDDVDGLPDQDDARHWGGGQQLRDGDADGLPDQDDPRHWGGGRR